MPKPNLQPKWVFLGKPKSWLTWEESGDGLPQAGCCADVGIMTTANDDSANVTTAASRFGLGQSNRLNINADEHGGV